MAKKKAAEKGAAFACPACKAEIKPTFGTITGISPQKCKCGKFLVVSVLLSSLVLGGCFATWYALFLLSGVLLPLLVQLILLPVWVFYGYKLSKKIMFRFVSAKDIKK